MPSQKKSPTTHENDVFDDLSSILIESTSNYAEFRELEQRTTLLHVGEFIADYSYLSPDEIAETDSDCAELFERSRPLSQMDETDLECQELFKHSKPVSR